MHRADGGSRKGMESIEPKSDLNKQKCLLCSLVKRGRHVGINVKYLWIGERV